MPNTFKMSEVLTIIKKKLQLSREQQQGVILFAAGKTLVKNDEPLSAIFEKHMDSDGFLYIVYAEEQVYGALEIIEEEEQL